MAGKLTWSASAAALIVLCLVPAAAPAPGADEPPKPGSTGTTVGAVTEITADFVRIQAPDGAPHRHWFKWSGAKDAKPDAAIQAAVSRLKVGDQVQVRWSFDQLKRLESIAPVTPATTQAVKESAASKGPASASATAPVATSQPALPPPRQSEPTGVIVNAFIDNLLTTGQRLLELPLFMLFAGVGVVGAVVALLAARLCGKDKRPRLRARSLTGVAIACIFLAAFIVDRKLAQLQNEVRQLRSQKTADAVVLLAATAPARPAPRRASFLFDVEQARAGLKKSFGQVRMQPLMYDEATDFVQVRRTDPIAQAFLAIVDLRRAGVEIKLGTTLTKKTLTSDFAHANDCTVAINGEAGMSSGADSGLGQWKGNLIDHGQVVLLEDTNLRPFLSFDRHNRASYSPAAVVDKAVTPEKYNVIWGRSDALLDGVASTPDARNNQPRTAMAISQDGARLYLLVVDGRQPAYSLGFTRSDVANFLKAFGAHDGMLCDEGGSSCIYLKKLGGISNIPSDNGGQERPTYTHFGIAFTGSE